jgi:LDH2 family malate/lactate/ureidoglycolate dehydrogenase
VTASASAQERYRPEALIAFAEALLVRSGMPVDKAADVARILIEGDCLGKITHGLALLPHLPARDRDRRHGSRGEPRDRPR